MYGQPPLRKLSIVSRALNTLQGNTRGLPVKQKFPRRSIAAMPSESAKLITKLLFHLLNGQLEHCEKRHKYAWKDLRRKPPQDR
ncbi:hypothetical protein J3458_005149 [Metarhizium acridum]|uniref:uncharacterized protein n=1 Tax=Metarhizium acridum TaxID=92637 RepID=UPI001C6CC83E|nr:hypothetical protein J3458_005149 [Metarhizium acridum]